MASMVSNLTARELGAGSATKNFRGHLREKLEASLFGIFLIVEEEILLMMIWIRERIRAQ